MGSQLTNAVWCVVYGIGIIGMLGLYGVIQERIMSQPYGKKDDGTEDMFKVSVFLVLCNRLVAIIYALIMVCAKSEPFGNKAPLWKYLAVSMSNVAATWCQYEALKYVSFPVQMLGKSFKMMPVMVWGILIDRKEYKVVDWLVAAFVTGGVTQFLLTGEISAKHAKKESSVWGLALLLAFLACDSFTSTFQEKLFKEHKTSKYNQMLYVNSGSGVVSAVTLLVSGKAVTALAFCGRYPRFMAHAGALSWAAVGGQFFIYSQVKEFGALVLASTMNLRQVVSILVSYMMYSKPISGWQVVGLVFVFGALFYKSFHGWRTSEDKSKHAQAKPKGVTDDDEDESKKYTPGPVTIGQAVVDSDEEAANGSDKKKVAPAE